MTLAEMIVEARNKSRVHSADQNDTTVVGYLNDGIRAFTTDVDGQIEDEYLLVAPSFDIPITYAIDVVTDLHPLTTVQLTSTAQENISGSTVAHSIQTALRTELSDETITVEFDTDEWSFTFTFPGTSTITVSEPTGNYLDGTALFSGSFSATGSSYEASAPAGSSSDTSLPAGFVTMLTVSWDGNILAPGSFQAMDITESGTPLLYAVYGTALRLMPAPSSRRELRILYKKSFAEFSLAGATYVAVTDGTLETDIAEEWQKAITYYAASQMAENRFEYETASRMYGQYMRIMNDYLRREANNNPKIGFRTGSTATAGVDSPFRGYVIT